jgi:hypothetical protein
MAMTVSVSVAQGIQYIIGQSLMVGGQWLKICGKFPIMDETGKVTHYNILVEKR